MTTNKDSTSAQKKSSRPKAPSKRDQLLAGLRSGTYGVRLWNARKLSERLRAGPYHQADLSGADLSGVDLSSPALQAGQCLDFQASNFDNAVLAEANLDHTLFSQASFKKATLQKVRLRGANCQFANFEGATLQQARLRSTSFVKANFQGADLSGADLSYADLCGADLSDANLTGTRFEGTHYDKLTVFPSGYTPGAGLERVEHNPTPTAPPAVRSKDEQLTLSAFLKRLEKNCDPKRLIKALDMLRAERFQLFSQIDENSLVGVVKSQVDPDKVYSCRLTSDGLFSCCDQNLELCLGLRGALCKHLLVLIVGLTRAGQADPKVLDVWVKASLEKRVILDTEAATATFLRYKGAEAGEVDWRPTETIPEDYYSL